MAASGALAIPSNEPEAVPARPPIRRLVLVALAIIALLFGGLGGWAAVVPLQSAAVAQGQVRVSTHRKTIQHLEGGIVQAILVKEGDAVTAGQVLVRLDDTRVRANLDRLKGRAAGLLATKVRLAAERDGARTLAFPEALTAAARGDPKIEEILSSQRGIFAARRRALEGRTRILRQRIGQLNKEIASLQAQVDAETRQLALITEEMDTVSMLVGKGLAEKPRLLALQRNAARIEGSRGEHLGLIARAEQRIGETELRMIDLENTFSNEVVKELEEVQGKLSDVEEQIKAAEDVLQRTEILAPQDGVVVSLRVHTPGGVIKPGEPILDIVPQNDVLLIEARINPLDIDVVHVGLPAQVRLTAYGSRHVLPLDGEVIYLSADSFTDQRTGAPYYLARIRANAEQQRRLRKVTLYPGMPAEVMILTGERTALDYALRPLFDSFARAFREQ